MKPLTQDLKELEDELSREEERVETGGEVTKDEKIAVYRALVDGDPRLGSNSGVV